MPTAKEIEREKIWKKEKATHYEFGDLLRNKTHGEEFPMISFYPKKTAWNKLVVVWVDGKGKSGMYAADGTPRNEIKTMLDKGFAVIGADLFMQGEFIKKGESMTLAPVVKNPRPSASFTYGYNHTLCAKRVHDVLTLIAFVHSYKQKPEKVHLVGLNNAGMIAAAARAQAGKAIDKAIIDTQGFRFASLATYRDVNFLSGIVKYGDLPALLALAAPHPLWIVGEEEAKVSSIITSTYTATAAQQNVRVTKSMGDMTSWLLETK